MNESRLQYCWAKVFTEPDFDYAKEDPDVGRRRCLALADGLSGWANCHAGADVPKGFGTGMVKIGEVLKISATPDNLLAMSTEKKGT